ncbi:MAG: hypothetical protein IKC71_02905 [Clostridia bacterium]|nr:hypothetical protein [Clostridia bacterium]
MKRDKLIYTIMIIAGALLTISYIGAIWAGEPIKIILSIVAMLGSGVLCSALVSLFLELKSEKDKKKQSSFILEGINNRLKFLLVWELKTLSTYLILIKPDNLKKTNKYKLNLKEIISKINNILNEIVSDTDILYQYNTNINNEYLKKVKIKNNLAFGSSLPYYKDLLAKITDLLIDSNVCLINGVFDEDIINVLKSMKIEISEIIGLSNKESLELLMEFRQIFFQNIEMYFRTLNIDLEEKQVCYIREVIEKTAE